MKFKLGQTVVTRGINDRIADDAKFAKFITESFARYVNCDWGELCEEDKAMNDSAVKNDDDRIVAKYSYNNEDIYIITEWDRSVTTILFTYEY